MFYDNEDKSYLQLHLTQLKYQIRDHNIRIQNITTNYSFQFLIQH